MHLITVRRCHHCSGASTVIIYTPQISVRRCHHCSGATTEIRFAGCDCASVDKAAHPMKNAGSSGKTKVTLHHLPHLTVGCARATVAKRTFQSKKLPAPSDTWLQTLQYSTKLCQSTDGAKTAKIGNSGMVRKILKCTGGTRGWCGGG